MSGGQRLCENLSFQLRMTQTTISPHKISPDVVRRIPTDLHSKQFAKSLSPSTCNSDDSGLDQTLNLTPPSPLPADSDSGDSNFSGSFNSLNNCARQTPEDRAPDVRIYRDLPPYDACKVQQAVQCSPSGCCEASTRDVYNSNRRCKSQAMPQQNNNRFHVLSFKQVKRLHSLLNETVPIHSRFPGFPTIWVRPSELFHAVQENLKKSGVPVRNIRLNGGAASYVIGAESSIDFNDIDILISVDLSSHTSISQRVKSSVLDALMQFLPQRYKNTVTNTNLTDAFKGTLEQSTHLHSPALVAETTVMPRFTYLNTKAVIGSDVFMEYSHTTQTHRQKNFSAHSFKLAADASNTQTSHQPTMHFDIPPVSCSEPLPSSNTMSGWDICPSAIVSLSPLVRSTCTMNPGKFATIPGTNNHQTIQSSDINLRESYIFKQFRKFSPQESDCWSLLSIGMPSNQSKVVEFKFVDRMRRQFEFTVDSFQIHLDSVLSYICQNPTAEITPNFYPTVVVESVACSYSLALHHLTNRIIVTREPEMIRGGGLLKYCRLLVNGYQSPEGVDVCSLERYMCSRFFIDFQDLGSQKCKIEAFLENHFKEDETAQKVLFLRTVYRVVSGSTICLMSFERFQTLNIISQLVHKLNQEIQPPKLSFNIESFAKQQNLSVDRIFFGTQLFPVISHSCCVCENSQPKSNPIQEMDSSYSPERLTGYQ